MMVADKPRCPACGAAYAEHLGLAGTCAKLQSLLEAARPFGRLAAAIPEHWRSGLCTRLPVTVDVRELDALAEAVKKARSE